MPTQATYESVNGANAKLFDAVWSMYIMQFMVHSIIMYGDI